MATEWRAEDLPRLQEGLRRAQEAGRDDVVAEISRIIGQLPRPEVSEALWRGSARALAQGTTAGFGDELTGLVGAVAGMFDPSNPSSFGETYRGIRDMEREAQERFASENPLTNIALQGGGAALTGGLGALAAPARLKQAVQAASPAARTLGVGGGVGAVEGLGHSEASLIEDPGQVAQDVALGAGLGAAGGAVGAGVGAVSDRFLTPLAKRVFRGSKSQARKGVERALESQGMHAEDVAAQLDELGPAAVPAQVPALTATGRAYMPREQRLSLLAEEAENQAPRVRATLRSIAEDTGTEFDDINRAGRSLARARRAQAKEDYDLAYAAPSPEARSPELLNLLDNPSYGPNIKRAYKDSGLDVRDPDMRPDEVRQMVDYKGSENPDDWEWTRLPTWREWDLIQRSLRASADTAGRQGNRARARAFRETRRALNQRLDAANPAFGRARQNYADAMAIEDATDVGTRLLQDSVDVEDFAEMMQDLTPAELDAVRRGALKKLKATIDNARDRQDLAVRLMSSPAARDKFALVFGDDAAEMFTSELDRTSRRLGAARTIATGSETQPQAQAEAMVTEGAIGGPGMTTESLNVLSAIQNLARERNLPAPTMERIGRMMGDRNFFLAEMSRLQPSPLQQRLQGRLPLSTIWGAQAAGEGSPVLGQGLWGAP